MSFNPLTPSGNRFPLSPKFQFYFKKGSSKNFLWASRLWVGRRIEPILGYVPKNEKKNLVHKGLNYRWHDSSIYLALICYSTSNFFYHLIHYIYKSFLYRHIRYKKILESSAYKTSLTSFEQYVNYKKYLRNNSTLHEHLRYNKVYWTIRLCSQTAVSLIKCFWQIKKCDYATLSRIESSL